MGSPPRAIAWLEIPDGCRTEAMLDFGDEVRFTFGGSTEEWQYLAFERAALERFVRLAQQVLGLPEPADRAGERPAVVA